MTNKIVFISYCHDHLAERFGLNKMAASFRYFHPDYKLVLYGTEDLDKIYKENNVDIHNALPYIMLYTKNRYDAEYVCHIDADSLVLGRLDKILNLDYEIAAQLNNPDIGDRDERQNRPQQIWDVPNNKYVSTGCLSTNSEPFLIAWAFYNHQIVDLYGGVKAFWMADINMMNILFHKCKFKTKILDPLDGKYFYGPSANLYSKNNHNPEHIIKGWGLNQWQSWFDIKYVNGEFKLYDKTVKLLHQSGGSNENTIKLHFSMFNPEILPIIKEITGLNE